MSNDIEIKVKINGEERAVPQGLTVAALLDHFNIRRTTAIVELNRKVIDRATYESAPVAEGDELEIVRFVGGG